MRVDAVKSWAGTDLTTITRTFSSGLSDEGGAHGINDGIVTPVTIVAPGQPLELVNEWQVTRGRPGG
jgi:hypothetical protein